MHRLAALVAFLLVAGACSSSAEQGFDDHTVPALESADDYFALAKAGVGPQSVAKFVVIDIGADDQDTVFMDSAFYTLHDEWFWFQLLNGQAVPGTTAAPLAPPQTFETINDAYVWAEALVEAEQDLPLGLRLSTDGRLYSDEFYKTWALGPGRTLGLGSIVHVPARNDLDEPRPEYWLFELEFSDASDVAGIEDFFEALRADLPPEIGDELLWVTRSSEQRLVGEELRESDSPYADRVVSFSDVVAPGEALVYNPGIAAGRLLLVADDAKDLDDARSDSIILIENAPDELPPGNGLVTATPQTPLAHVNLLARNRGIPNASLTGMLDDPELRQLARIQAPVIIRAQGVDQLEIVPIPRSDYDRWLALGDLDPIEVPRVNQQRLDYTLDLVAAASTTETANDFATLARSVGGKATGMVALLQEPTIDTPPTPLAITTRAYAEHLDQADVALTAMLDDGVFQASPAGRYLMLEGIEDYDERYLAESDGELRDTILNKHPIGTPVRDVIDAGGFRKYVRSLPMAPATLSTITADLQEQFGAQSPEQGLRFRSSSTVEDIEGFNGAGLYTSNTGFLDPRGQVGDEHKTIEWALKKTWSSYWGSVAFEEREREQIDHRSGTMAVLVHARFDDPLEVSNGVATLSLRQGPAGPVAVLDVNAQVGDTSVANPQDPSVLPEVTRVTVGNDADMAIERLSPSTLASSGEPVLSDDQLRALASQTEQVAASWLARSNAALEPEQRSSTVTLDFEFRDMAANWPAAADGQPNAAARMVLKQVRTLDPGLRRFGAELRGLPVPRDVLATARSVEQLRCQGPESVGITVIEVLTNPLLEVDLGFDEVPFWSADDPAIVRGADGRYSHTDSGEQLSCERKALFSSPEEFLLQFLADA